MLIKRTVEKTCPRDFKDPQVSKDNLTPDVNIPGVGSEAVDKGNSTRKPTGRSNKFRGRGRNQFKR